MTRNCHSRNTQQCEHWGFGNTSAKSSNFGWVELGVRSTSVLHLGRTWTKNLLYCDIQWPFLEYSAMWALGIWEHDSKEHTTQIPWSYGDILRLAFRDSQPLWAFCLYMKGYKEFLLILQWSTFVYYGWRHVPEWSSCWTLRVGFVLFNDTWSQ